MNSGIYAIVHVASGKSYVGSALNTVERWGSHRRRLRNEVHHSPPLQAAWLKYGEAAFYVVVLELCESERLYEREQVYIDQIRPEYNVAPVAGSPRGIKRNQRVRRSITQGLKRYYADPARSTSANQCRSTEMRRIWADPGARAQRMSTLRSNPSQARQSHRPDWTPEMDRVLRAEYPAMGSAIASKLGVSRNAVRQHAMRLGIVCTVRLGGRRKREVAA